MKCPIDGTELRMTERAGVEIDYCPQCRGVWLDRGELDKIIERSSQPVQSAPPPQAYGDRGAEPRYEKKYYKKKKKNFLEDLFDF
ncbi:zf-TFIIB domain-containing protein [Leisingera daeponensis]|uniref:Zf-TFIIB domain-containing protein n=1 Tax=Leisingera daeponensis TaxID=405746 RepID=A0ABS7NKG7_9RHOB|nr:zf-TFIIB domain-containing protein [Leisingera daeponensis]MBY6056621.1 zf-TFIIB domain-containing protein [Leisingera daeponensis]MBY6141677.1 zf-TFIIB domain-containing protein [Leisingera daeponensis]